MNKYFTFLSHINILRASEQQDKYALTPDDWLDLKFVLELSRHGHRGSIRAAGVHEPKLSTAGGIQSYKLGLGRREFYIDEIGFLSPKYKQA